MDAEQSRHRSLFIEGPAGRLEAVLWMPPPAPVSQAMPALAAVVCHPHPLFGGTMHNKVVFQVAKTFDRLGLPILRFNFRGAGLSEGEHDRGRGEASDLRAALDFLAAQFSGCPLLVAGFSFGASVGLGVGCKDPRVRELVGLGLPVNSSDLSYLADCAKPKLFLQGDRDAYGARNKVEGLVGTFPHEQAEQTRLVIVPDADHFFTGKLDQVEASLRAWLTERHPQLA